MSKHQITDAGYALALGANRLALEHYPIREIVRYVLARERIEARCFISRQRCDKRL
jgi:hypothetical protein